MDCGKSYRIPRWLMSRSFSLGELTQILIERGIPQFIQDINEPLQCQPLFIF